MNKSDLISELAKMTKIPKSHLDRMVSEMLTQIQKAVSQDSSVKIAGFGTFEKVYKKSRTKRNPKSGEPVQVAACYGLRFKPSSEFKNSMNRSKK